MRTARAQRLGRDLVRGANERLEPAPDAVGEGMSERGVVALRHPLELVDGEAPIELSQRPACRNDNDGGSECEIAGEPIGPGLRVLGGEQDGVSRRLVPLVSKRTSTTGNWLIDACGRSPPHGIKQLTDDIPRQHRSLPPVGAGVDDACLWTTSELVPAAGFEP